MQPASNDANGTPESCGQPQSAPPSDSPASLDSWESLIQAVLGLTAAIAQQAEAIDRLAASNEAIVDALAAQGEEEEEEPQRYMDGTPINGNGKSEH